MRAKFAHIVFGAVYEARLATAQIGQAKHIQARRIDDAAIVLQRTLAVKDRYVQPGIIRAKTGRPDHRANMIAEHKREPW